MRRINLDDLPAVLATGDAAKALGISPQLVWVLCRNGKLPGARPFMSGGRILHYQIPKSAIAAYLARPLVAARRR